MKPEIKTAVDRLKASYGDVKREVLSYSFDSADVLEAFLKSEVGTVEHYILGLLRDNHPSPTITATVIKGKSTAKVVRDVVSPKSVINESGETIADSPAE
jgi:hypothetical protein